MIVQRQTTNMSEFVFQNEKKIIINYKTNISDDIIQNVIDLLNTINLLITQTEFSLIPTVHNVFRDDK